jgi:GT2 family glycosyltransferase
VTSLPVSVVIPAYEREAMVARAVRSALAQAPAPPDEVLVVDDGSRDGTAAAAEALGARVIRHEVNRGAAAARNTGVQAARHEWLAMLDSDDEWLPWHLATLWPHRAGHVLVAGAALAVSDDGSWRRYVGPVARGPRVLRSPAALYPENFIPASGVLVRRDAVLAAGGYRGDLRFAEDLDLWIRVLDRGPGLVVPRVVVRYGVHPEQKSAGERSRETQLRIVTDYADRPWWRPRLVELQLTFRAWDALRGALRRGARRTALREAAWIAGRPSRWTALARLLARRWAIRRRSQGIRLGASPTRPR